jgi:hypothetical protein
MGMRDYVCINGVCVLSVYVCVCDFEYIHNKVTDTLMLKPYIFCNSHFERDG